MQKVVVGADHDTAIRQTGDSVTLSWTGVMWPVPGVGTDQ